MQEFILNNQWIIWLAVIWTIPWKAVALWKSARKGEKIWFAVFLFLNTLAILEIIYIFFVTKKEDKNPLPKNGHNGNGGSFIRGL